MQICDVVSLAGFRKIEKKELQRVSYVQNINNSITSIIPTIATVFTFVVHTLLGLSLNTSDVSTPGHGAHTVQQPLPACPLCSLLLPGVYHHRHLQLHEVLLGSNAPVCEVPG